MKPDLTGLAWIDVMASEVHKAEEKAREVFDDWQAQVIEILLIPAVYDRWLAVNRRVYAEPSVTRIDGLSRKGKTREDNRNTSDWSVFAGYVFSEWNGIAYEGSGYSHGPSRCWDGLRRNSFHSFIDHLRAAVYALGQGLAPNTYVTDGLAAYKMRFVDDLEASL